LVRSSVLGRMPASESLLALTNTMQRIGVSPFRFGWRWVLTMLSTLTSKMDGHDRHSFKIFFTASNFAYETVKKCLWAGPSALCAEGIATQGCALGWYSTRRWRFKSKPVAGVDCRGDGRYTRCIAVDL
jgi:hypothetical protein